jgi:hypothetical protein
VLDKAQHGLKTQARRWGQGLAKRTNPSEALGTRAYRVWVGKVSKGDTAEKSEGHDDGLGTSQKKIPGDYPEAPANPRRCWMLSRVGGRAIGWIGFGFGGK